MTSGGTAGGLEPLFDRNRGFGPVSFFILEVSREVGNGVANFKENSKKKRKIMVADFARYIQNKKETWAKAIVSIEWRPMAFVVPSMGSGGRFLLFFFYPLSLSLFLSSPSPGSSSVSHFESWNHSGPLLLWFGTSRTGRFGMVQCSLWYGMIPCCLVLSQTEKGKPRERRKERKREEKREGEGGGEREMSGEGESSVLEALLSSCCLLGRAEPCWVELSLVSNETWARPILLFIYFSLFKVMPTHGSLPLPASLPPLPLPPLSLLLAFLLIRPEPDGSGWFCHPWWGDVGAVATGQWVWYGDNTVRVTVLMDIVLVQWLELVVFCKKFVVDTRRIFITLPWPVRVVIKIQHHLGKGEGLG